MTQIEYEKAIKRIGALFDIQESGKEWTDAEDAEFIDLVNQVELYEAETEK